MSVLEVQMLADLRAAPEVVRRQEIALADVLAKLAARLRRRSPQVVVTCARGSSAHAASFGKYLIERRLGVAVAAASPSTATIYRQRLRLAGQFFLAVSQSGKSGDLVEQAAAARESGAVTACLTNDTDSELAHCCEFVLPMSAGPELSIPATKTFIASLAAIARLTAFWAQDEPLADALRRLPDRLAASGKLDWSRAADELRDADSLVTIGRGPTLAIAREAALKLKETSDLHAEAFSSAEFLHGPIALVSARYPVLIFAPTDAAAEGVLRLAGDLREKGAAVFLTASEATSPFHLAALAPDHPDTDAICLMQSFYSMIPRLAEARGTDVDRPRHLRKVTRTR
jgi:glucosamine--fructose-6-phosphate aminotransferase (isomerizing)